MTQTERRSASSSTSAGHGFLGFLRELPALLFVAFLLAFLLRMFVVQVFFIPSRSMEPTLQVDDRIVVEKLTYVLRDPRRGEVVVFEGDPDIPEPQRDLVGDVVSGVGQFLGLVPADARDVVKRVIGLPGETVEIRDGRIFVDGRLVEDVPTAISDPRSFGPYEVPEASLFVMGDNRPNSSDSRFSSLGFVGLDDVVGRAAVVIWPPTRIGGVSSQGLPEQP